MVERGCGHGGLKRGDTVVEVLDDAVAVVAAEEDRAEVSQTRGVVRRADACRGDRCPRRYQGVVESA